jgi:hypothetical protein
MHAGRLNWPKNRGVAPADMAFHNSNKNIFESNKQPRLSVWTTPTFNLPYFKREIVVFYFTFS